ncbi:hypothetical protein GCM10022211_23310 [Sphingomonas humi]|uniref:Glycosyltransferase RgtA/B/C/D-like domain-containing protein n=1 Tax=Sphingomonas humi TaxID=335630 RepID=A0ABP7SA47_9SPHN
MAFVVATLSLLWPALLHGKPFLFADSSAYVRVVDAAVYKSIGYSSAWTRSGEVERLQEQAKPGATQPARPVAASEEEQLNQNRVPLLGRSVYYGMLAYGSALTGQFWLLGLIQAAAIAAVVLMFLTDLGAGEKRRRLWLASLVLLLIAGTSTLPFFTSFVMPDVFAGVAILAATMLIFSPNRMRGRTLFWFLLAAAAALFHSSHVLIIGALAVVGALITLQQRQRNWGRVGLVLAAALTGIVGEMMFAKGVEAALGTPPIRPPFLTARLIDDGPGMRFIQERCATRRFYVCEFRDRLPQASDIFLWDPDPARGVFNTLDPAGKRRIAEEQGSFVLAVVLAYPGEVLASTTRSAAHQLGLMRLSEFRDIDLGRGDAVSAPDAVVTGLHDAGRLAPYVDAYANLSLVVAVLALLALPFLVRMKLVDGRVAIMIVAGVLVNALVCGGLSTPHDRYGARVLWVLPLLAASAMARLAPSPRGSPRWRSEPISSL